MGELTGTAPDVHAVVKPVVLNCNVRSTEPPVHIFTDLSVPKEGFGLMLMVSNAVSEHPVPAIN